MGGITTWLCKNRDRCDGKLCGKMRLSSLLYMGSVSDPSLYPPLALSVPFKNFLSRHWGTKQSSTQYVRTWIVRPTIASFVGRYPMSPKPACFPRLHLLRRAEKKYRWWSCRPYTSKFKPGKERTFWMWRTFVCYLNWYEHEWGLCFLDVKSSRMTFRVSIVPHTTSTRDASPENERPKIENLRTESWVYEKEDIQCCSFPE